MNSEPFETDAEMALAKPESAKPGRRSLLRNVGLGAAGIAALSATGIGGAVLSSKTARAQAAPYTDADIANFALNLEYLEANYYLFAATGQGLPASLQTGTGTQGTVTGGSAVPFQLPIIQQYADNLASDEQAHVQLLRTVLGSSAVAMPNIDLQTSWTNLAMAAGLIQSGQTFNPFADEISFLLGAFVFEDVGVTAYGGALASLLDSSTYVTVAGSIEAVESYHAATIRTLLASIGAGDAVQKISNARAALSGENDDQGILMPSGAVNIGPFDSNALVFRRTPRQVLNIVYFAANATSGGFFPSGMNGTITS